MRPGLNAWFWHAKWPALTHSSLTAGNVFTVFFSLTYGSGHQLLSGCLPLTKGNPLARRILLADDSVTAQNMGRRILTDAGYEVLTVNNGSAALKKIAELKPDIIVLDVYMPGYGGLEVCQRVKENRRHRSHSGSADRGKTGAIQSGRSAARVGADAFIVKPFEATELLTALTKLEDKIVAQPEPQKSGRFAKALAAVEQSETRERFGDKETGWKNRLTIPSSQCQTQGRRNSGAGCRHAAAIELRRRQAECNRRREDLNVPFQPACR